MARILVVEPDSDTRNALCEQLASAGHDILLAANAADCIRRVAEQPMQIVLMDWSQPDLPGSELLARLRNGGGSKELRVVVVDHNHDSRAAAQALDQGADDFVAASAPAAELNARIAAALRRMPQQATNGSWQVGPIELSTLTHRVTVGGAPVELAPAEYRLMAYFLQHPGRVHDRQHLLENVWGRSKGIGERTVDVQVRRLRALLEPFDCADLLQTVRGFGYRFGP